MALSATKHTIFAILSAVEADLRSFLQDYVVPALPDEKVLPSDVRKKVERRWAQDVGLSGTSPSVAELIDFLDMGEEFALLNRHNQHLPEPVRGEVQARTPLLESLIPVRNRIAHARPLHNTDFTSATGAAESLAGIPQIWKSVNEVVQRLRDDPSFVLGLTIPVHDDRVHNLPTPEWDETGFFGRTEQLKSVLRFLRGPYPVISLVGEGGLGKTSLALKAAYDLLDSEDYDYDAIVWTSSKTTKVTPTEVERIEGAISTSLGLLQNAALTMGGAAEGGAGIFEEVLSYLGAFRILLILDNLETVLDDTLEAFFQALPTGSKVLTTSRIGLGAFEQPIKLAPMRPTEAAQLLRALARVRGMEDMATARPEALEEYATRLQNNPGFIRWFVSAVAAGARPEEALADPGVFLDFCMSNIYEHLSDEARGALRVLLCVAGQLTQAELAHYSDLEVVRLQRALNELLATNMVSRTTINRGNRSESVYEIMDLARLYLARTVPGTQYEYELARRKGAELELHGRTLRRYTNDPFDHATIVVRDTAEIAVSKYLQRALAHMRNTAFESALEDIHQARALAPDYFEVHRVEAQTRARMGDLGGARQAFDAALECEAEHAPLHMFFGEFLERGLHDYDGAAAAYRRAGDLHGDVAPVAADLGRVLLRGQRLDEAYDLLVELYAQPIVEGPQEELLLSLELHYYEVCAASHMQAGNVNDALTFLEQMAEVYGGAPARCIGKNARERLRDGLRVLTLGDVRHTRKQVDRGRNVALEFKELISARSARDAVLEDADRSYVSGFVYSLKEFFGWIRDSDDAEYFFHANDLSPDEPWAALRVGTRVKFRRARGSRGPRAVEVSTQGQTSGSAP